MSIAACRICTIPLPSDALEARIASKRREFADIAVVADLNLFVPRDIIRNHQRPKCGLPVVPAKRS